MFAPGAGPAMTSLATRHFNYGLVIGIFFLSWFLGGELMSIDIRSPFFVSCAAAVLALVLLYATWNRPEELRRITR